MSDALRAVGTIAFVGGAIAVGVMLPSQVELQDTFLALLSALWVIPPVFKTMKAMFRASKD